MDGVTGTPSTPSRKRKESPGPARLKRIYTPTERSTSSLNVLPSPPARRPATSRATVHTRAAQLEHEMRSARIGSPPPPPGGDALEPPSINRLANVSENPEDRLGELIASCTTMFDDSESWEAFVKQVHGPSSLQDNMENLPHPAGEFLASLHEHGAPCVQSDEDWSLELLDERMAHGCHRSANEHRDFIRGEMADFVDAGFYAVLPYSKVRHLPGLRLSPLGIKEERDRRARLVVDHTWFLVNKHTLEYTTKEAMQFGGALYRVLYQIYHADPKYGTTYLAKYDVKDGFYRVMIRPEHALAMTVILPTYEGEEPMVAVPLVLTMGWINSPPTFCAVTETACDIANDRMYRRYAPIHRLEHLAATHDDPYVK